MAEFFDITKDSKKAFEGTKIMDTEYAKEMNQYPTIFVSFASAKGSLEEAVKFIKLEIANEYKRYAFVLENISEFDQPFYDIIRKSLNHPDDSDLKGVSNSLAFLTEKLDEYYHKKTILFIDEYTPACLKVRYSLH